MTETDHLDCPFCYETLGLRDGSDGHVLCKECDSLLLMRHNVEEIVEHFEDVQTAHHRAIDAVCIRYGPVSSPFDEAEHFLYDEHKRVHLQKDDVEWSLFVSPYDDVYAYMPAQELTVELLRSKRKRRHAKLVPRWQQLPRRPKNKYDKEGHFRIGAGERVARTLCDAIGARWSSCRNSRLHRHQTHCLRKCTPGEFYEPQGH